MTEIDDRDSDVLPAEDRGRCAIRPNTAPAYYLGRPARLWITVMRPRSCPPRGRPTLTH